MVVQAVSSSRQAYNTERTDEEEQHLINDELMNMLVEATRRREQVTPGFAVVDGNGKRDYDRGDNDRDGGLNKQAGTTQGTGGGGRREDSTRAQGAGARGQGPGADTGT